MANVAPGDIAYITGDEDPKNLGKVVKVLGPPQHMPLDGEQYWDIKSEHEELLIHNSNFPDDPSRTYYGYRADILDRNLRKLAGPGVDTGNDEALVNWVPNVLTETSA
jgi:hypothetical protein